MKKLFTIVTAVLLTFANYSVNAQANVLNPADPDVIYTSSNQPAVPAWGVISKWGHTNRLSWNPYSYGYLSYYFEGMAFRLKFPKSYKQGVVDGKKYPLFIFYHGLGESGNIWDNEYQLFHGGQGFAQAVNDSAFDGFILVPQSQSGYLQSYFPAVSSLIDSMVKYTKLNIDRISIDGLSGGGQATWDMMATQSYAQKVCSALPISAADYNQESTFASFINIPIWTANGGQDVAPYPSTVTDIINYYKNLGGNIIQSLYPNDGHDAWDDFWNEPNLWSWISSQHKANPLVYFQHSAFCANQPISAKLGVQSGFYAYQWEKNGLTINGATTSILNVTDFGTYACRYERTATSGWSVWSPTPVVISQMQPTITPPIQINGLHSNVLPAPDGSTTVPLMVPNTFASYEWHRVNGTDSIVSTANTFNAPIGQYDVRVTQQFGCSSNFSPVDTVIAANGTNLPPAATNVSALALSSSSVEVDWNANPHPQYSQTGFEIYRSTTSGSNYKLVTIAASNALTYTDQGLSPNVKYYYIIRAINNNGAAPVTSEVSAITLSDVTPPTAPQNLKATSTTRSSVSLAWDASTDNVGVVAYDVYINGAKAYSTVNDTITVYNLTALQTYAFSIKARDASGNVSPASSQVTAAAALNGLSYSYYQGSWSVLPNFSTLTPFATGVTPNVSLTPALQTTNFGFLWQGYIIITKAGSYSFETSSDDGSALYIGGYNFSSTPLVNNDGLHGTQTATGTITLAVGVYPIAITYFQSGGGTAMSVLWKSTAAGILTYTAIPNSAFADVVPSPGAAPAAPGFLTVTATSYNKTSLSWTDNSTNETGFEVSRSIDRLGVYQSLGTTGAGVTSFVDSVGLSPNTVYWYKIRAVNANGASAYVSTLKGAWLFNNDLTDGSGNNNSLTGSGSPTFSASAKEGAAALSLNGTNQYADMTFSTGGLFPDDAYTTRTIGLWINPTAATISGTNKIVYSLGSSTNGIALRFNAGALQAGIASGSVRSTVNVSSITTNAKWVSGGWNYVAVVYNVNSIQLFVNGSLLGTTSLSFSSVASATVVARVGASNTSNAFNSSATSTNYGGLIDDLEILAEPVNAAGVLGLMNHSYTADTTLALPAIPAAPSNLIATATSASTIALSFKDNSGNETGFQLYRAIVSDTSFRLQATLPAGSGAGSQINYTDNNLFANTAYYYRVRAIGAGGNSAFTAPDATATTQDNNPVIANVANVAMHFGTQVNVAITATDVDGDPITFALLNPAVFASLTNGVSGTATLQLNPASTNQGSYTMAVVAYDNHAGTDTTTFTIVVNANFVPVVTAVSNQTMNAGDALVIPVSANDQDGNGTLVWSLTNAPSFATIGTTTNGAANITLNPGYAIAGTYTIVATVNDGAGGVANDSITVTINKQTPPSQKIYMDMRYTSANAPAPWNNISGVSTSNLLNSAGQATTVGLQFIGTNWDAGNAGAVTGNNSGVYPDAAISDYFWFGIFGAPSTVNVNLTGLTTTAKYNVTLFGSSTYTGSGPNGTTIYTINGVAKSINISNNTQNTVTFSSIAPDATGTITINLSVTAGTPYGALNTIVLEQPFNDGTVPVLPTNLTAQSLPSGYVQLNWTDNAYNEASYLVYRGTSATGPFTLLNAGASNANTTSYVDSSAAGNSNYYYEIAATNSNGSSGQTAPVNIVTQNRVPTLTAIANQFVKTGKSIVVNVAATDDASNVLTTTVNNLPAFATYQSTGNGTGKITLNPGVNDAGVYNNIVVKVADNFGAVATDTFNVQVTDSSLRSVYVNFGSPSNTPQAAPWNNYLSYPFANNPLSNLMDDANTNSGFSVKLLDQWDGNLVYGMTTGNNSGVFPDNVLQSSIYSGSTATHTIEIDGLNPAKRYDVGFMVSFNSGDTEQVTFKNGTQTITVDERYNTSTLAQLNGITPTAAGAIQVTVTKATKTQYLALSGLVIQEYLSSTKIVSPSDLFATTVLDTAKIQLNWADKSSNETGFQVWRSTSANGTYTLVTTTAANVTSYLNTGLTPNTRYFYKIRAVNGTTILSNYSNIATVALASKIVMLNLNADANKNAPSPWNNTNAISQTGGVTPNLINTNAVNTGFAMTITENFQNTGFAGVSGAGIFPANVMISNYWTDASVPSEVLFSNLDVRKKYRIGCFGSNATANFTTASYSCNGHAVVLNSFDNNSKIVYLDQLVPNANGQLYVDITTVAGSPYSFTGAFTIEYYDDTTTYVPPVLSRPADDQQDSTTGVPVATTIASVTDNIKVYPNPFSNKLTVELNDAKPASVGLSLYDANSRLVYSGAATKQSGNQVLNIEIPNASHLQSGSYIFNVTLDGKVSKSMVLIKVN